MVCNGFGHGFSLVVRALVDRGCRDVAVEVPGYDEPRAQIRWAGATPPGGGRRPRASGSVTSPPCPAGAVVVTPAHQSPTGSSCRPAAAPNWSTGPGTPAATWSRTTTTPSTATTASPSVPSRAWSPTGSSTTAPCPRAWRPACGWVAGRPPDLLDDVRPPGATDHMTASIVQATFAEFLERGDLDRHLRRTRRIYRQRRDALVDGARPLAAGARVGGVSAGLSVRDPALGSTAPTWWPRPLRASASTSQRTASCPPTCGPGRWSWGSAPCGPRQVDEGVRRLAPAALGSRATAPDEPEAPSSSIRELQPGGVDLDHRHPAVAGVGPA